MGLHLYATSRNLAYPFTENVMKVQLNPYMRDCLVYRATLRDLARTKDPEQREYLQGALEQLAEVIGVEQAHAITDLEIQKQESEREAIQAKIDAIEERTK